MFWTPQRRGMKGRRTVGRCWKLCARRAIRLTHSLVNALAADPDCLSQRVKYRRHGCVEAVWHLAGSCAWAVGDGAYGCDRWQRQCAAGAQGCYQRILQRVHHNCTDAPRPHVCARDWRWRLLLGAPVLSALLKSYQRDLVLQQLAVLRLRCAR